MRLSNKRYEEIKKSVAKLYQECEIKSIPISVFEIASKLNINVVAYSDHRNNIETLKKYSNDGFFVETTKGEYSIYYNDDKPLGRINYTIMHEIGHIVLNHADDNAVTDSEAQFFAKYALAPPALIYKYKLFSVTELENVFGLSNEAANNALKYFNTWEIYSGSNFTDYEQIIYEQIDTIKK